MLNIRLFRYVAMFLLMGIGLPAFGQQLPDDVGILGDAGSMFTEYFEEHEISIVELDWNDDVAAVDVVIVNAPDDPGQEVFDDFLAATDSAGTGVVFVDTYRFSGSPPGSIYLLQQYAGQPTGWNIGFGLHVGAQFYEVLAEHPVLEGFEVGEQVVIDSTSGDSPHSWFEAYEGDERQIIADAGPLWDGQPRPGIGVEERENNRHVLLSLHGAEIYAVGPPDPLMGPPWWTQDAEQILENALNWVTVGTIGNENDDLAFDGTHRLSAVVPNPVNGFAKATLEVADAQDVRVELFDVRGRKVVTPFEGSLAARTAQEIALDAGDLAPGVYVLRISGDTFAETQRVTIAR